MIRRLAADEWELLRALRLEALEREPQAFLATYAETLIRDDAFWQDWAASGRWFMAERDGEAVGLAAWYEDADGRANLVSMYVRAEARGLGVGAALVEAVCAAVRDADHERVVLGVAIGSPARRLYERCGFVATGAPYVDPELGADEMARAL